jgi:hypothetical protein
VNIASLLNTSNIYLLSTSYYTEYVITLEQTYVNVAHSCAVVAEGGEFKAELLCAFNEYSGTEYQLKEDGFIALVVTETLDMS